MLATENQKRLAALPRRHSYPLVLPVVDIRRHDRIKWHYLFDFGKNHMSELFKAFPILIIFGPAVTLVVRLSGQIVRNPIALQTIQMSLAEANKIQVAAFPQDIDVLCKQGATQTKHCRAALYPSLPIQSCGYPTCGPPHPQETGSAAQPTPSDYSNRVNGKPAPVPESVNMG